MVSWIVRALMLACVVAALAAGWNAGARVSVDVARDAAESSSDGPPYKVTMSGPRLMEAIGSGMKVANAAREGRIHADQAKTAVLERVEFERSAGGVVARGSITDLGGPRRLYVVIDAFDADRAYMSSSSASLDTQSGSTAFSVSMNDDELFASFAVRFLDAGMTEIQTRSSSAPATSLPPLLADDMLHSGDLPEVVERLVSLGYADSTQKVVGDAASLMLVQRFRKDHMLSGPGVVTVGDLVAIRAVTPQGAVRVDLSGY